MHPMSVELEAQRKSGIGVSMAQLRGPKGEADGLFGGVRKASGPR